MTYIPLFFSLEGKKILLIGSGSIAQRKLNTLLTYTTSVDIITKECNDMMKDLIEKHDLLFICKAFEFNDLIGYDIVIACIDNLDLQKDIYKETRKNSQLYSCIDFPKYCDFIFPSVVQKGDLQVAFSTNGSSPSLSKELRVIFEKLIPDEVVEFLDEMKKLRSKYPKGEKRQMILKDKVKLFMNQHFIFIHNNPLI